MDVPHELLERLGVNGECVDLRGNQAVHPELAQSQAMVKKDSGVEKDATEPQLLELVEVASRRQAKGEIESVLDYFEPLYISTLNYTTSLSNSLFQPCFF